MLRERKSGTIITIVSNGGDITIGGSSSSTSHGGGVEG